MIQASRSAPSSRSFNDRAPASGDRLKGIKMKKILSMLVLVAVALSITVSAAPGRSGADRNTAQTAVAAGQFKTLAKLLTRAGLATTLQSPGPYTVFAPTDAAFTKLPKRALNALLRNKAKLRDVLLYHVVSGKVAAADVVKLSAAKTLNGKSVRIHVAGSNVFVNTAKVTKADVMASNGVIHVINRVLVPPAR
jgi:uncharacterized surface protein with fasciclin (FAS1) repeats